MLTSFREKRRRLTACLGSEDGQALIETYFSSALLVLILLGGAELGRIAYAATELSNAARAAAQYAAMNGGAFSGSGLDTAGMLLAAQSDAADLGSSVQFTNTPSFTCTCTGTGTATCGSPPSGCSTSHLQVTVNVQVQASFNPLVYIPGFTHSAITLYGSDQEVVLQ